MFEFFTGKWGCSGEFASGKKIEADLSFTPELDGKWLLYRHADLPPGRFKSIMLWGRDKSSKKLTSVVHDNSGSARLFVSDGWKDGSITFTPEQMLDQKPSQERFRYDRQSASSFKMTYERLAGEQWKMADFIVCSRQ